MAEIEFAEIVAGGFTFRARVAGPADGRLVLLLHGFPETSAEWVGQLSALGDAGYRAVAFDQRGYSPGARPAEEAAYDRDALVGDVLAVADALGATGPAAGGPAFDLVGHDWGGAMAWQVAGLHPDRVRTVSVVSTPHPDAMWAASHREGSDQRERSSYMKMFRTRGKAEELLLADDAKYLRAAFKGLSETAIAEYLEIMRQPGALTGALNWYRAIEPKSLADAGTIEVPALYVWGAQDPAMGRLAAEMTAAHVSGPYQFVELPDADHWVPENAAAELNESLLEHLATY
ncbi:alpha/beta fold hydrolase [Yinghuangia sp. YIM S09857]|uniref:alpha/beta fold hydrolase n=1 Tax=Yinghuangia sp. YIM S09857 TaxID=3436929 RepID=UPI003F535B83